MISPQELASRLSEILQVVEGLSDKRELCQALNVYRELIEVTPERAADADYQSKYKQFYRMYWWGVRKTKKEFIDRGYFKLLGEQTQAKRSFQDVMKELFELTGRRESSFSSKILATADPHEPVIDSVVKAELGIRDPYRKAPDVFEQWARIYDDLRTLYRELLASQAGCEVIERFDRALSLFSDLTPEKKIDFLLWKGSRLPGVAKKQKTRRRPKKASAAGKRFGSDA